MSEEAEKGNWAGDFKSPEEKSASAQSSGDKKQVTWMKFGEPGSYRIRLCGNFVKFHRWWSPFTERLITHLSYKDQDKAWVAGFWPRKTYAIHIIDRNDKDEDHPTGKLKILEKGSSIFEVFANYMKVNEINPASKDGPDFVIDVTWPEGNKRQAKYKVTAVAKPAPWTAQEVAMIKEDHAPLTEMYKTTPLEKINEAWDALPDESKIVPPRDGQSVPQETTKVAATAPIEEAMPTAPAEQGSDDDLFGDDGPSF